MMMGKYPDEFVPCVRTSGDLMKFTLYFYHKFYNISENCSERLGPLSLS